MSSKFLPEALFELGYTDLISVSPPGAQLVPSSKIVASQLGKVPAMRKSNGLYVGYDWRRFPTTLADVRQWCLDGSNIGLRADRFPAVDIDCTDPRVAQIVEDQALEVLGVAPIRIGRAPKRLLMFRTEEPFTRMRLWIKRGDDHHLVELLGQGQQYLVHGTHPGTMKPYEWNVDLAQLPASALPLITREQAQKFMDGLVGWLDMLSVGTVTREGDGRPESRAAVSDQSSLHAPSVELLREAVDLIPNTNVDFPTRQDYLKMGYAIRGACGDDEEAGFDIFASWAERWEGNDRVEGNDPDVVRADWRRFKGPFAVGWSWVAEKARPFGFNDATLDFDALEEAPKAKDEGPLEYSDQWLAEEVVRRQKAVLRYVPQRDCWLVWSQGKWRVDAELLAEDIVKRTLRQIANEVLRQGATDKEKAASRARAMSILSADKASSITRLARSDRGIAVSAEALDHDPWILNTPNGIIDLRSGKLGPASPDALCTKSTSVPAEFGGSCSLWRKFLAEATGGDAELEGYLKRYAGYSLTGSTKEEQFAFLYGKGGNGKGTFIDTITAILNDYATTASMDTFTESYGEKHSTDLAMMAGARLVTADETKAGKKWDDQRVKSLTGGGRITARFMRQDNFTFKPQFKLLFAGNAKPALDEVDKAMRRRLHLVPFTVEPKRVDKELKEKLQAEWPAILAWMLEGCLEWQEKGLAAPACVVEMSEQYFEDEDLVGQWLNERCIIDEKSEFVATASLYQSYVEWCNAIGSNAYGLKRFVASVERRLERTKEKTTRRAGFKGVRIQRQVDFEALS